MEPKYRVVRSSDIFNPLYTPAEAAVAAYNEMVESDQDGELPIVTVTEIATGDTFEIDLSDHIDAVEGGSL